jgi:hypothetical protein
VKIWTEVLDGKTVTKAVGKPAEIRAFEILRRVGDNAVGAEIGVHTGALSSYLLATPRLILYMIDPWSTKVSEEYKETDDFHTQLSAADQIRNYWQAKEVVRFAGDRARILRKRSPEVASEFDDGFFDFVFIDGDHSYSGVVKDIEAWWPKVKKGGFLSGHDYDHPKYQFGVKKAVDERFQAEIGGNYTWFVRK